jgi:hypothetical protein
MVILFLVVFGCFQLAFGQNRDDTTAYLSTGSGGLGNNSQADGDRSSKCKQNFFKFIFIINDL